MRHRTTDLLDVFRPGGGGPAGKLSGKPGEPERPARAPKAKQGRFEGFFLGPRQLLLGSSVVVLLLVLSFTVGLGVGRKAGRGGAGSDPSLRREETIAWALRGRLGRVDVATGGELTETKIVSELQRKYQVQREMVRVDMRGDPIWIVIGPFATEQEAAALLERRLKRARLWSAAPFLLTKPESFSIR